MRIVRQLGCLIVHPDTDVQRDAILRLLEGFGKIGLTVADEPLASRSRLSALVRNRVS